VRPDERELGAALDGLDHGTAEKGVIVRDQHANHGILASAHPKKTSAVW
jgi:hypothetical protein